MKRFFTTMLICSAILFSGLVVFATIAPHQFAHGPLFLGLFRLCGAGIFIGMVYLVVKLFSAGMRSSGREGKSEDIHDR